MPYIVVKCDKCGTIFISKSRNQYGKPKKTTTCPSCRKRITISPGYIEYETLDRAIKARNKLYGLE